MTDPKITLPITGTQVALIDGNPLPQAPKTTANFTLKYTQPVGAGDLYASIFISSHSRRRPACPG